MKFQGRPKAVPGLCLPGESGWLLWSYPGDGGGGAVPVPLAPDEVAVVAPGTRIGLPARHLVAIPMWFQTVDTTAFHDLAEVELERRGLLGEGAAWDHLVVRQEESRSLVAVFLVDAALPSALIAIQAGAYEVAARCRPLPENACLLWREQGGLALGATRDCRLVSLRFFPGAARCGEVVRELAALRRGLILEGVLAKGAGCVAWGEFAPDDLATLVPACEGLVRCEPLPPPVAPDPPLSLRPPQVAEGQRRREQGRRRLVFGIYAVAVYFVILLAGATVFGWQAWEMRRLSNAKQAIAPAVEKSKAAAARWRAVAPAIDTSFYPLECFRACVNVLPLEVRLTDFEHSPEKVLILGEAKNAAAAFRFLDKVKADPFLKKWTWVMPTPELSTNNRAQIHLEGTRAGKTAH